MMNFNIDSKGAEPVPVVRKAFADSFSALNDAAGAGAEDGKPPPGPDGKPIFRELI